MTELNIDQEYLQEQLNHLLLTPSPSGMTDDVVRYICAELEKLEIRYELTRRGAVRAIIPGRNETAPRRAIAAHLDTLGAMVKGLKRDGRLRVVPIGHWNARFAEGARVKIHCDNGSIYTGTILPLKASGHTYNTEVDSQESDWDNLEIRVDEPVNQIDQLWDMGVRVGDFVSVDSKPEFTESGFVNGRHLDDKAGVACMLATVKALRDAGVQPELDSYLLFTISEEVGVGASHILMGDIAEMVSIDNGTNAPGQNTCEYGVTIAMQDSSGPFDRHLNQHLIGLCKRWEIEFSRDIFRFYRSDAASALEAGNDIRTSLICFGLDASHGWERVHMRSLEAVTRLLVSYLTSKPMFDKDQNAIGAISEYPLIHDTERLKM
ncbi:MAG: osmoprotectant NAGGN system M42 family peptidase [Oceanospirillaceae bacterium]|uniref:osmoprotectant NAGGN system M42 family peptidase n=1 Tax=Marinobacterium litorale TaxID=404770 RepID=UPI0004232A38|nr:osmoprotectant NAGGN system M42 family peptidase [Marinobacterium litorale]MBT00805.1 osmoprotectant NAGGN system M42 family peptidase [Oceanospirillaceae bacterium]